MGVKDTTLEVGAMDRGKFFVSMEVWERAINLKWEVILVYGPADHSRSPAFLDEVRTKVSSARFPVITGGDFNLIRSPSDKSNARVDLPGMQRFNDCIADLGLRELDHAGASDLDQSPDCPNS